jgi:hypothetical protein
VELCGHSNCLACGDNPGAMKNIGSQEMKKMKATAQLDSACRPSSNVDSLGDPLGGLLIFSENICYMSKGQKASYSRVCQYSVLNPNLWPKGRGQKLVRQGEMCIERMCGATV